MSTTLTRPGSRLRRSLAGALTTALAASSIALLPSSAQAAPTGDAVAGTATWGLSTYLNSSNFGRPNPLAASYVAPASFDDATKLSTWGNATGTVADDGTASLAFDGTSVNFAKTGGAWLKLADLEAEIAPDGSGTVSAVVSYGASVTGTPGSFTFDPAQAPQRGPVRVDLVDLDGNSAADRTLTATSAAWNGLDGEWSEDFLGFLAGDATADPAIPGFIYAGQINNTATDRTVLPISFSVTRATAAITSATITEQTPSSLKVAVSGTGYKSTSPGIYIAIGETGNTNVVDAAQYLGTVWSNNPGTPSAKVQPDGSFAATLSLTAEDIAKLDPTKSYSVVTFKAHGQAASDASQTASTPVAIDFAALGLKVSSVPTVSVPASTYGSTRTVTVTVPKLGAAAPTGTVTLSGAVAQTATLAGGTATFALPKTLGAGSKALTASYSGDANYKASSSAATLVINKDNASIKLNKIKKAPTSKKAGKTSLTVKSTSGAAVTGKVKVTFKKGKKTKTKTVTIKNGKGNVTIPKLAKGTWKITVQYTGSSNFNKTATKKAGSVKVKK